MSIQVCSNRGQVNGDDFWAEKNSYITCECVNFQWLHIPLFRLSSNNWTYLHTIHLKCRPLSCQINTLNCVINVQLGHMQFSKLIIIIELVNCQAPTHKWNQKSTEAPNLIFGTSPQDSKKCETKHGREKEKKRKGRSSSLGIIHSFISHKSWIRHYSWSCFTTVVHHDINPIQYWCHIFSLLFLCGGPVLRKCKLHLSLTSYLEGSCRIFGALRYPMVASHSSAEQMYGS